MNARSSVTLAAVSALCAAFIAVPAVPAQGETVKDSDAVGDMSDVTDEDAIVAVPDRTLSDVRATKLTHSAKRVAVRVDYVDLQKVGEVLGIFVDMYTDEKSRTVELSAFPADWSGKTQLYNWKFNKVSCDGIRHSIDYADNIMTVSVPRRCLGNPRWVNFRVLGFAEDSGSYWDDALSDNPISSVDGNWLKWSGKVHQG
jgi:hypothetical protein